MDFNAKARRVATQLGSWTLLSEFRWTEFQIVFPLPPSSLRPADDIALQRRNSIASTLASRYIRSKRIASDIYPLFQRIQQRIEAGAQGGQPPNDDYDDNHEYRFAGAKNDDIT